MKDYDGAGIKNAVDGKDIKLSSKSQMGNRISLWKKFKDSAELWLFTMRGIGWNWQVGGIPEREPQSARYVSPYRYSTDRPLIILDISCSAPCYASLEPTSPGTSANTP